MFSPSKLLVGTAAAVGLLLAGPAAVAFAAGTGYGPGAPGAPGQTGAYSQVACAKSTPASGDTVSCTVDGAAVSVTVPSGDLTAPAQVVMLDGTLPTSGATGHPELAFGVQLDQDGQKLPGPFSTPISVSVSDSAIAAGSVVYQLGGTGFAPASGWTVSAGHASGSFSVDVDYLVALPVTTTAVPQATTPVTGEPFLGEGLIAAGLVALGGFGTWRLRRTRRPVA